MAKSKLRQDTFQRSRTKTLGVRTTGPYHHYMTYVSGAPFDQVYPAKSWVSSELMTDWVTPLYAQCIKQGEIVNRPLWHVTTEYLRAGDTGFRLSFLDSGVNRVWQIDKDVGVNYFGMPGPVGVQRVNTDNLIHLAQTAALAGVQAPLMQAGVALGELDKTLRMLLGPGRALRKLFTDSVRNYERDLQRYGNQLNRIMKYRSHKRRNAELDKFKRGSKPKSKPVTDQLEFIPDMVLAYNLGWKPLMMDIDAVLNKIPALEYEARRTSRSKKSDSATWSETNTLSHVSGNKGVFRFDYDESVEVRAGVLYADSFSANQHFGTRLVDVPETVWELIPFSFLSDYFVNLGDYLGSLRAVMTSKILAYFTTTHIKTSVVREWSDFLPAYPWLAQAKPVGSEVVRYEAVARSPDSFMGSLAFSPMSIAFKPASHAQNVISLLTKTLYGIKRNR